MALNISAIIADTVAKATAALQHHKHADGIALLDRFPGLLNNDTKVMRLYGLLLFGKADFAGAEAMLAKVIALDPTHAEAIAYRGEALANLGRRPEAIAIMEDGMARLPQDGLILFRYLPLLLAERGPAAALAVLRAEKARTPQRPDLATAVSQLRQKALSLHDPDELQKLDPDNVLELTSAAADGGYTLRGIYEAIEPLGANCEFGFVQRRRGAEPLALFRWTSITPDNLIRLLSCRLDGYERPDIYALGGKEEKEYWLKEEVFGTQTHTGVNRTDIAPDEFLAQMTRRQLFLKRKFLADAAEGRKIFMYKANGALSEEQMTAIETELAKLGVRRCLFVTRSDQPELPGTVKAVSPTRMVGWLSKLWPDTQVAEWDRIVTAAYDHFVRAPAVAAA